MARQPIDLGKTKGSLSRDFYQASCGIEEFLENEPFLSPKLRILQNLGVG